MQPTEDRDYLGLMAPEKYGETWQQADLTVGADSESSHLELQTESRESALATSHGFWILKSISGTHSLQQVHTS